MIKTSLCVKHGDSGGPMWSGDGAVGITSGGTDLDEPCNSGVSDHRSFYQPMWDVESQSGLKVY